MIVLILAASLLIGVSLGILGGGGSILTVPILVYLAGQDSKEAIATSLFVVGVTSLVGLVPHARAGRVRWRTGLLFGGISMIGAYGGGRLAEYVPGTALLVAFALMMLATAAAMLRKPRKDAAAKPVRDELPMKHIVVEGLAVGAVTGLVGSGGGFLVVPALALLGGLPMSVAVGTSLLVIAMKSFSGLAGHLAGVHIDWRLALIVTAAAVVGSLIGSRFAGRIPQDSLRKAFGWFVVVMGVFVLSQQLGSAVWTSPLTWSALAVAVLVAAWRLIRARKAPKTGREKEMVSEVDVEAFAAAHADGALVVDVREPHEYAAGHVPGARLVPMREVRGRLAEFASGCPVYVICASGRRSLAVAGWMAAAGIDARSVAGGTGAWIRAGRPVTRGLRESAA